VNDIIKLYMWICIRILMLLSLQHTNMLRRCRTLLNPVLWQSWTAAYPVDEDTLSWLTNYASRHAYKKKKKTDWIIRW